jgi:hypothetical protein
VTEVSRQVVAALCADLEPERICRALVELANGGVLLLVDEPASEVTA